MVIGIEAERANHQQKTGVEHYAQQLILQFAKDTKNEYILYLRTPPQAWFSNLPSNFKIKILGYGPIPFPYLWTQLRVSWEMLVAPPDVLFIPAASLPIIHPANSYVTLHDIAWKYYPETFKVLKRWYLEFTSWFACRFAKKVIAVSESTKRDLIKFYKVPASKVITVPHGYTPSEKNFDQLTDMVRERLPEKYILFLSTIQPRKNLSGLIKAFRELKTENPELPHKLVVVGKPGWKFEEILRTIEENKDIVVYLNHVLDNERWGIYHRASLFVHPSVYEGFGMWILEAFDCEVPAAVANNSSLPEVGGDAALYFDPYNKEEMKNTILKVLRSPELGRQLVEKGKERLKQYSWERCGEETLAVLESTTHDN
jgi:glycosyltransferase involved in cell wall biosynthesis